jgi:hypothetical protein
MTVPTISNADVHRIAAESEVDPRTIRRAYEGQVVRGASRTRIERATKKLRIAPPPAESWYGSTK